MCKKEKKKNLEDRDIVKFIGNRTRLLDYGNYMDCWIYW